MIAPLRFPILKEGRPHHAAAFAANLNVLAEEDDECLGIEDKIEQHKKDYGKIFEKLKPKLLALDEYFIWVLANEIIISNIGKEKYLLAVHKRILDTPFKPKSHTMNELEEIAQKYYDWIIENRRLHRIQAECYRRKIRLPVSQRTTIEESSKVHRMAVSEFGTAALEVIVIAGVTYLLLPTIPAWLAYAGATALIATVIGNSSPSVQAATPLAASEKGNGRPLPLLRSDGVPILLLPDGKMLEDTGTILPAHVDYKNQNNENKTEETLYPVFRQQDTDRKMIVVSDEDFNKTIFTGTGTEQVLNGETGKIKPAIRLLQPGKNGKKD